MTQTVIFIVQQLVYFTTNWLFSPLSYKQQSMFEILKCKFYLNKLLPKRSDKKTKPFFDRIFCIDFSHVLPNATFQLVRFFLPLTAFSFTYSNNFASVFTELDSVYSENSAKQDPFSSVAKPEPVEPKLFEIWSRSRNYHFNKYLLQSVWRMLG